MTTTRPRVLLIGPFPPPYGGVSTITEQLAGSDLRNRWDLIPLNVSTKGETREAGSEWRGFKIRKAALLIGRTLGAVVRRRPDAAIVMMSGDLSVLRAALVGAILRLGGVRTFGYFHGTFKSGSRYFPFSAEHRDSAVARLVRNFCLGIFHRVIFLSEKIAREFSPAIAGRIAEQSTWIENFVPVHEFRPVRHSASHAITVLYVGRLSKVKGFFDLLAVIPEIAHRHPEVRFAVCGTSEREDSLRAVGPVIQQLQANGTLLMHGLVWGKAKTEVFRDADIFVLPSHVEIFPVGILEGMAQGLPIVASAVGVVETIVRPGQNGVLITPGNRDELRDALLYLIEHAEERARMGSQNRMVAELRFDRSIAVGRLEALVEEELSSGGTAAYATTR